jgi:hypothetical protein
VKKFALWLFVSVACCSQVVAQAITFTFTASATATGEGYTSGASYTFSFTTGASYATLSTLSQSVFNGTTNEWKEEVTSDSPLFVSAGGSGLLGSYTRPTTSSTDPNSYIYQSSSHEFQLSNGVAYDIGLTSLGGTPLKRIFVSFGSSVLSLSPAPAYSGSFSDPTTYFGARDGVYAVGSGTVTLRNTSNAAIASFNVSQVAITAIPEPGAYAALAGLAVLVLAGWRRRGRGTTPAGA